ncbi:MAG: PTS sugar transporter subunit IIA [Candidatus Aminicenantes bacterium]|jgi:mannitol/fructose-specific phosphotransferase system IIA component (Ntr-type)
MVKAKIPKHSYFCEYLKVEQVIFNLKARDKIQALEELLDVLVKLKYIKNKKPVLTRIIDRERLVTTAIGHGIALPHARLDTGCDIAVVVGRSEKGLDFEAVDGKKVRFIILIVWNPSIPGLFNHLFAGLAQFLIKPGFRERIFEAKNRKELHKILCEIELTLLPPTDKIISRAGLLWKLQKLEIQKRKADKSKKKELQKQANLIRDELDSALLDRFDKLMERYGFAVAELEDGACQGCFINVATGMRSAIEGSDDIYVCENCGKYLVAKKTSK